MHEVIVDATAYATEAEAFGYSTVFRLALKARLRDVMGSAGGAPPWWLGIRGADWRRPGGPLSKIDGMDDRAMVGLSRNDASANCEWTGQMFPIEAKWECAPRGRIKGAPYPWGDRLLGGEGDGWRVNIVQGKLPTKNTADDGFLTTAPGGTLTSNGYGLGQTVGTLWEWSAEWSHPACYLKSRKNNPLGPEVGTARILRGGSYLCHDSYSNRCRNSARSSNIPDSSMGNAGILTVTLPAG